MDLISSVLKLCTKLWTCSVAPLTPSIAWVRCASGNVCTNPTDLKFGLSNLTKIGATHASDWDTHHSNEEEEVGAEVYRGASHFRS